MKEKESTAQVERKKERRALFAPAFALRVLGPPHRFSNILPPPGRRLNKTKEKKKSDGQRKKGKAVVFLLKRLLVGINKYTHDIFRLIVFFFCSHVAKISDRVKQSNSKVNGDQTNRTWTLYIRRNAQMCVWPSKKKKKFLSLSLLGSDASQLQTSARFMTSFCIFLFRASLFFQKKERNCRVEGRKLF